MDLSSTISCPIDMTSAKEGILAFASSAKSNIKWIGREIFALAKRGSTLLWEGIKHLATLVGIIWEASRPQLQNIFAFISSPLGKSLAGGFCALVLGQMALSRIGEENKTARYALGLISIFVTCMTTMYASQMGLLPIIFAT